MTMGVGGKDDEVDGSFNPNTDNFTGYVNPSNYARRQSSFDNEENSEEEHFGMPGYHFNQNMDSLTTRRNNTPRSPIVRENLGHQPPNNEGKSEE